MKIHFKLWRFYPDYNNYYKFLIQNSIEWLGMLLLLISSEIKVVSICVQIVHPFWFKIEYLTVNNNVQSNLNKPHVAIG